LVLLLLVCVAGLGLVHMSHIQGRLNEIAKENNRKGALAAKMNFTVYDRMIALPAASLLSTTATAVPLAAVEFRKRSKDHDHIG
jgi:hypothetical protein